MTAISTSRANGETIDAAHVDVLALALKAIGITDDNLGKAIFARAMPFALPGVLGDANVGVKAVDATTYTVPAGVVFVITRMQVQTNAVTITPSGGSPLAVATGFGSKNFSKVHIPLGPGDAITCGALCRASGYLVSSKADCTPIQKTVTNAAPYTVPASSLFVCTYIGLTTAAAGIVVQLSGVSAFETRGPSGDGSTGSSYDDFTQELLLKATDTVASASATPLTIAGYLLA